MTQDNDEEVYVNPEKPAGHTVYSVIDQFNDGNAHPKGHQDRGPFFNRTAKVELTDTAKRIVEDSKK